MKRFGLALAVLFLFPAASFAQGVLIITNEPIRLPRPVPVPQPPQISYRIEEISIAARLRDQLADVQVSQTFSNDGARPIEAQFVFPLPYDGAIDQMTLMVNGKELPAKLLSAEEARARYESIVRRNRDPALLEWIGTGMFQTSVFPIPPGEKRTVSLHYGQLLRKDRAATDFLFPLSTARFTSKPIQKLSIRVAVDSATELKNIYSPTHPIDIKRNGDTQAVITFEAQQSVPREDFRLLFDSHSGDVGATLFTYRPDARDEGYFLLLASPEVKSTSAQRPHKTISFVVDKSGSMSGAKIDQARDAARFILNNLREGDLFNIISYDSQVQAFRPELQSFDPTTHEAGLAYVDGLYAGGGTNIQEALLKALSELRDEKRPNYLLFLTDGLPTAGETNESRIAQAARAANSVGARLLVFGVGYDVNSRLLDRLATENHGLSEYVRPDEDIETHVSRVFQRISSPVLTGVQLMIDVESISAVAPISRVYPTGPLDLFEGEQLVVVGRYKGTGPARIRLAGHIDAQPKTYTFDGTFADRSDDSTNAFIARLWATRRIGEIIDELDLKGKNQELVDELVQLSTKYGILTPYTAFLADETVVPQLLSTSNNARAAGNLNALSETSGRFGFAQRELKQRFLNAPQPAPAAGDAIGLQISDAVSDEFRARGGSAEKPAVVQAKTNTLYRRGKLLVTPETAGLDVEKDKSKLTVIERFSPEYFALVAKNSQSENELLSQQHDDEELLVQYRGVNYLIK